MRAAPTRVQVTQDALAGGPVSLHTSIAFAAPGTRGDLVVVALEEDQQPLPVVTDNYGDTYQPAVGPIDSAGFIAGCCADSIFYGEGIDGGVDPLVLTFTYGNADTYRPEIVAAEYSGMRTLNALDGTSSDAGSGSALMSSGSLVTHADGELLFVAGTTTGAMVDAGAGFTLLSPNGGDLWADSFVGAAGPYTDYPLANDGRGWMVAMASFFPGTAPVDAGADAGANAGAVVDAGSVALSAPPLPAGPLHDYEVGWGCEVAPFSGLSLCGLLIWPLRRLRRRRGRP